MTATMHANVPVLRHTRLALHSAVARLSSAQLLMIPAGFDNNIAWNLGHLLAVQQRVCYLRTGLAPYMSGEEMAGYLPGTSPADWSTDPDCSALVDRLLLYQDKLEADAAADRFPTEIEPYKTSQGVELGSFDDLLMFNNYHEGLHYGTILSLKNFVAE